MQVYCWNHSSAIVLPVWGQFQPCSSPLLRNILHSGGIIDGQRGQKICTYYCFCPLRLISGEWPGTTGKGRLSGRAALAACVDHPEAPGWTAVKGAFRRGVRPLTKADIQVLKTKAYSRINHFIPQFGLDPRARSYLLLCGPMTYPH